MIYLIISLVAGLIYLISGKVQYNKKIYLEGTKARIAGLIFLAPVGLILVILGIVFILVAFGTTISDSYSKLVDTFASNMVLNGLMIGLAYINFYSVSREIKTRGGCLTYWIPLWALVTILIFFNLHKLPHLAQWVIIMDEMVAFFQIISFIGIWLWKKWGVFGYIACVLLSVITSFFRAESVLQMVLVPISSLSFILILYLLVKPKWQFFE